MPHKTVALVETPAAAPEAAFAPVTLTPRIVSREAISPALRDFIDTCLVPILVKKYLEEGD